MAAHRRKYTTESTGPVKFEFQHLFSRINFAPALTEDLMYEDDPLLKETDERYRDEFIQFRSIQITGLKTKASYTLEPDTELSNYQTSKIKLTRKLDNSESKVVNVNFENRVTARVTNNNTYTSLLDDDDALLMLPQEIAEGQEVTVVMTYTVNDDERERTVTFPLSPIIWEVNKIYTYKFTIDDAYPGQIKDGSLEIDVDDSRLPDADDESWINTDGTDHNIGYEFKDGDFTVVK